jgi:hypothetical protein
MGQMDTKTRKRMVEVGARGMAEVDTKTRQIMVEVDTRTGQGMVEVAPGQGGEW